MITYDTIGEGYDKTRQADPYITDRLCRLLQPAKEGLYLDIGCGTGNYLAALAAKGIRFYGVDPSQTMLEAARQKNPDTTFLTATAGHIPLPDAFFDGAIAVLTLHHWRELQTGLAGLARVLKPGAKLVIFSYTPEQMMGYWLYHYFPQMIERCMADMPAFKEMEALLINAGFMQTKAEKYFIRPAQTDHFLYSHKSRPGEYLKADVRNNTSAFRLHCSDDELKTGLRQLKADIESDAIAGIMRSYENDLGDYLFISAERA